MNKTSWTSIAAVALLLAACATEEAAVKPTEAALPAPKASLYDRLGGIWGISQVVDDFMNRLVKNKVVMGNPQVAATGNSSPLPYLKFQVSEMVCEATGGPCKYTGKNMRDSHVHLKITEAEWNAMAADFKASLDHFKVPAAEQNELFAIVGTTKGDIVAKGTKPVLYDRLGGVWGISQVVDDFMDRLVADKVVMANPQVAASGNSSPLPYLKWQVTQMVCAATGGPFKYFGKSMKESHSHLKITEAEWNALVVDFKASLAKYKVPAAEQQELLGIIGPTKADIVTVK